jgi:hypothetical protein
MKRVMVLATRVECNEESNGFSGMSNGDEGGGQAMATRVMATVTVMTWEMAMVRRLMGKEEEKSEGGKGNGNGDEGSSQ